MLPRVFVAFVVKLVVVSALLAALLRLFWRAPVPQGSLQCGDEGVDVVYTWVNGSDPVHAALLAKYEREQTASPNSNAASSTEDSGRFRDYDTLRFSMRSVRAFFPRLRRIHLVIGDGEALPSWLDARDETIRVVRHSQIMPRAALPTFNSNAIETNLHLIPGLSPCFLYLNDDMFLGRRVDDLSWFWENGSQKVHFGHWTAPYEDRLADSDWHLAVAKSNHRLDEAFGETARRQYVAHGCYFFHKTIFERMRKMLDESFRTTLYTRFRTNEDNVVSFIYGHVALQEFGAVPGPFQLYYSVVRDDVNENVDTLRHIVRRQPQCICLNDDLGAGKNAASVVNELRSALSTLLPEAAPWELESEKLSMKPSHIDYHGETVGEMAMKVLLVVPVWAVAMMIVSCVARIVQNKKDEP